MASGNTLAIFMPAQGEPPASNFATFDARNVHPALDFDASTSESIMFSDVMVRHYGGGGITVYLHYAMASAVAGDVVFDVQFERIGDGQQDIDSDGFATAKTVTVTVPGTSGNVDIASIAFTDGAEIDSIAIGEAYRIKVTRDVSDAADTAAGDLELVAVELVET